MEHHNSINNRLSNSFLNLQLKDQVNFLNNLKKDFRTHAMYMHFAHLMSLQQSYIRSNIKNQQNNIPQQPPQQIPQQPPQQISQKPPQNIQNQIPQNQLRPNNQNLPPKQQAHSSQLLQAQYQHKQRMELEQARLLEEQLKSQQNTPRQPIQVTSQQYQIPQKRNYTREEQLNPYSREYQLNSLKQTQLPIKNNLEQIRPKTEPSVSLKTPQIDEEQEKIERIKNQLRELRMKKEKVEEIPQENKVETNVLVKKEFSPNFNNYLQNFMVMEKLKKIVEKKNVALIGPANYLTNINQGEYIDSFDIVIRFNSSIMLNNNLRSNIGSKTDVWAYNFKDISLIDKVKNLPQLIFCPYPQTTINNYNINKQMPKCPIEFIEESFFNHLKIAMNLEPNSALMMILVLLRQNIKSLYISGISFLYDGYYDNPTKNNSFNNGALILHKEKRNNFMSIVKKLYNANDKLFIDNTMINLIYPNFIMIINKLFSKENHNKLFSTLNYHLFNPSFQEKYNAINSNAKIYVHFGSSPVHESIPDKMNIIIHSIEPKLFANEIYCKNEECDYDDLENLLVVKNKGIVYFTNNQWAAIDNMIPSKNRNYILSHHCYVNGNIYGPFLKYIVKDFDIDEDDKNLNLLYMLFSTIYYGQKMVYVSKENVLENGMKEIINVMKKLNLIKYIA